MRRIREPAKLHWSQSANSAKLIRDELLKELSALGDCSVELNAPEWLECTPDLNGNVQWKAPCVDSRQEKKQEHVAAPEEREGLGKRLLPRLCRGHDLFAELGATMSLHATRNQKKRPILPRPLWHMRRNRPVVVPARGCC